ncbi:MAG: N-acetylmuramoyl-L-alanine amidase [Candidatus Aenigmatarchaeota archaeon]
MNPRLRRIMQEYQEKFPRLTQPQLLNKLNNDDRIQDMITAGTIAVGDIQAASFGGPSEEVRAISSGFMAINPGANPEQLLRLMRGNARVQVLTNQGRITEGDIRDSLGVVSGMGRPTGLGALERGAFGQETKETMKTMLPRLRFAINAGRTELGRNAKNIAHNIQEEARGSVSNARKEYDRAREAWEKYAEEMASLTRYDVNKVRETFRKKGVNLENTLADIGIGYNKAMEDIERRKLAREGLKAEADNAFTAMKEAAAKYEELMKNGYTATRIRKEMYEQLLTLVPGITQRVMDRFHLYDFAAQGEKGVEHMEMDLKKSGEFRDAIDGALKGEAGWLSEWWAKHTVNWMTRNFGFLTLAARAASLRAASIGDLWHLIVSNLWAFVTGPWIWGLILLTFQAGFMAAYAPPDFGLGTGFSVTIFAALSAVLLALINLAHGVKYPMEVIDHLISGAIIGYATMMFIAALGLYGIGAGMWWGGWLYWIIVLIVWCIGVFQIYAMGGFPVLAPIVIIIMVFAWFSFGPYSGYVREIRDQFIQPVKQVGFYLQDTVTDIWLLVTNPSEYFARQQLKAAKPEKAMSYPKGIEVQRLDLVPDTIEEGGEFVIYALVKNEGEQEARSVTAKATCVADRYLSREQGLTTTDCRLETSTLPQAKQFPNAKTTLKTTDGDVYQFDFKVGLMQETGTQQTGVWPFFQRETVTNAKRVVFNNINVSIEYEYETASSLLVEVATQDDVTRRQKESNQFYYQEIATAKVGPAMIGMTVGFQPLVSTPAVGLDSSGKSTGVQIPRQAILVLTVINKRPDGFVVLEKGTDVVLNIPTNIAQNGTNIQCSGQRIAPVGCNAGTDCLLRVIPIQVQGTNLGWLFGTNPSRRLNDVIIDNRDYQRNFAVLCRFTVANDTALQQAGSRTGVITATIGGKDEKGDDKKGYKFVLMAEKRIAITPAPSIGGQIPALTTQLQQCNQWFDGQTSNLKWLTINAVADKLDANDLANSLTASSYDTNSYSVAQNSQNMQITSSLRDSGNLQTADSSQIASLHSASITGMATSGNINVLNWYRTNRNDLIAVAKDSFTDDPNFYGLAIPVVMTYDPSVESGGSGVSLAIGGGPCDLLNPNAVSRQTIIDYVEARAPLTSIFKGKGGEIYDGAVKAGLNPAFMLALAIHEGGWGTSQIARDKLNTFGYGAIDSDPYRGAVKFSSVEESFNTVAKAVCTKWLAPNPVWKPQRNNLAEMSGNTATGPVYATDTNWPNAMARYMSEITGAQCTATSPISNRDCTLSGNALGTGMATANLITGNDVGSVAGTAVGIVAGVAVTNLVDNAINSGITKENVLINLKNVASVQCGFLSGRTQMSCVGDVIKKDIAANPLHEDLIRHSVLYQQCEQCFGVVDQTETMTGGITGSGATGGVAGALNIVTIEQFTNNQYKKSDFYEGGDLKHEYITLHHTGGSEVNFLSYWHEEKLGCHYIVDKDGTIINVVDETRVSACTYGMNLNSISIEIVNKGNSETDMYTGVQVAAVRDLVAYLKAKYNIPGDKIVGHGYVAKEYGYGKMCCEPCGFPNNDIDMIIKRASCEGDQNKRYELPRLSGIIPVAQSIQTGTQVAQTGTVYDLSTASIDQENAAALLVSNLYANIANLRGIENYCAAYATRAVGTVFTNPADIGINNDAWHMLANMIAKKQLVCKYSDCIESMIKPGDFVFFRNPSNPRITSMCVSGTSVSNRLCTYDNNGIRIENFPVSTHVAIAGKNGFVFDQWGIVRNGPLLRRVGWSGYISAIVRPNYQLLTKRDVALTESDDSIAFIETPDELIDTSFVYVA